MRLLFFLYFISLFTRLSAQEAYEVVSVAGINTVNDEIVSGFLLDKLLVTKSGREDLVNDYEWHRKGLFHLEEFSRGRTYAQWHSRNALFKVGNYQEGPGTFSQKDSVLYFSSTYNYGKAKGLNVKIYMTKLTDAGWSKPQVLPFCDSKNDYTHPFFDDTQNLLVFSSNREGGAGKMDLWFAYKLDIGWSELTNMGGQINTPSNEIFPTIYKEDIYYSTNSPDGLGGYDIRKALRAQQWQSFVALPAPLNSSADDLSIHFLNDDKGFLTSNRKGGVGGDDIYLFQKKIPEQERHKFTAQLYCDNEISAGTGIVITNALKEQVADVLTDAQGKLDIQCIQLNRSYRFQLYGINPQLYTKCVLYILDETGTRVREIRFNSSGFVELELLQLNYADLNLLRFEDQSLLTINLEGQLFQENPGDIGRGEPITILDEKGEPTAIAYTNENGKFRFNKVKPQENYVFKLAEESKAQQVLLLDKGEKITLPVLQAEVNYRRIDATDAIALTNEFDETIYVSPRDVFIINRIYYEYKSANLTQEAHAQLDQLYIILAKNEHIEVELRSHTDSRGSAEFNLNLSKRRAESAANYLTKKGIKYKRFKTLGFGESQLLNECADGFNCSEPEHSINRRTEIKLKKVQLP